MEERKQKEIFFYDQKAQKQIAALTEKRLKGDFEGFNPFLLESYRFLRDFLGQRCKGKKVLDYGCGNAIHTVWLAKAGAEVVGIDLSDSSLQIAREIARREGVEAKTTFAVMDCERLTFKDNSFDIIFDGGTFSSLDLRKAMPELVRVLKPDGFLIGIETLGHNPFTNLKRKQNRRTGKRTEWAADHIYTMKDLAKAEAYFGNIEPSFFHVVSWAAFPFLGLPGGKFLLTLLELADHFLLRFSFFRKYAFKIVFIFSSPKQ